MKKGTCLLLYSLVLFYVLSKKSGTWNFSFALFMTITVCSLVMMIVMTLYIQTQHMKTHGFFIEL